VARSRDEVHGSYTDALGTRVPFFPSNVTVRPKPKTAARHFGVGTWSTLSRFPRFGALSVADAPLASGDTRFRPSTAERNDLPPAQPLHVASRAYAPNARPGIFGYQQTAVSAGLSSQVVSAADRARRDAGQRSGSRVAAE